METIKQYLKKWITWLFIGGVALGATIQYNAPVVECNLDVPSDKKFTTAKFNQIVASGYSGCNTVEDMMKPLNEYYSTNGTGKTNGKAWWIEAKNKAPKSKAFKDVIYDDLKSKYDSNEIN